MVINQKNATCYTGQKQRQSTLTEATTMQTCTIKKTNHTLVSLIIVCEKKKKISFLHKFFLKKTKRFFYWPLN